MNWSFRHQKSLGPARPSPTVSTPSIFRLSILAILLSSCRGNIEPASESAAACWVLSKGGKVTIRKNGKTQTVSDLEDLPFDGFAVLGIDLSLSPGFHGEELCEIYGLKRLRTLNLKKSKISDADLDILKDFGCLESLNLAKTDVSDIGLVAIGRCPLLKILTLSETEVTGSGFGSLSTLNHLQELDLTSTPLAQANLQPLVACYNLNRLVLANSGAASEQVKALKKNLTFCEIID